MVQLLETVSLSHSLPRLSEAQLVAVSMLMDKVGKAGVTGVSDAVPFRAHLQPRAPFVGTNGSIFPHLGPSGAARKNL